MAGADTSARNGSGDNQVGEIVGLVRAYAEQETIGPLKGLGRYVALGAVGSTLIGIGVILLALSLLRVLQTETGDVFAGNWSWVPYLIVLVVIGAVFALAVSAISRGRARKPAKEAPR